MKLVIQQTAYGAEAKFCVRNEQTHTEPVALPDPAAYPVEGYPDKRLLRELAWYLEQYLEFPAGADAKRARAVVDTLRKWGGEVFNRLFVQKAYAWYAAARENLKALELKIESGSPEVLSWPWEALYSADDGYLAQQCCMERQPPDLDLPVAEPPEGVRELHILFIVSRPDAADKAGYHNLEREVIRYVRDERYAVTADVLRPPTFDELRRVLRERPGYYHIVHFDGHGGYGPVQPQTEPEPDGGTVLTVPAASGVPEKYQGMEGQLVFEKAEPDENGNDAEAVGAEKLGQLLNRCGVKMMVLNACQSAMIDGQAADPFASVAARLLKAGVPSVAAMGYSLYVSGAKQFVPAFYDALFRNGGPAGAMRAGRQAMFAHPERACFYGTAPLQDWMVPELYQQIPAGTRLLPHVGKVPAARRDAFPRDLRKIGDYGFIGRGREIHDLERILQRQTQAGILIHGMAGAGKTTLAKGFLHWLRDTGGLRENDGTDCPVFWFEFQSPIQTAEAVLNPLSDALLEEGARTMDAAEKLDALTEYLYRNRVMMVWDNFESASGIPGTEVTAFLPQKDRRTLKQLLHDLRGGKTRVFLTSRTEEDWLSIQECARLETLGGLEGDELWDYCAAVVRDLGLTINREDPDLKALVKKLDGNPLALRAVLLRLNGGKTARDLLAELDASFDGAEKDAGTKQMQEAFRVLWSGMDPALAPVLQVLGLFEHYADADWVASILWNIFQTAPDTPEANRIDTKVTRCFQILENAGLCIQARGSLYRLHPALRGVLAKRCPAPEDVRRWFVWYLAYVERQVHNDAAQRGAVFDIHEANFHHAKTLAQKLDMRKEDLSLTLSLASYADDRSRSALAIERCKELAEKAHRYGNFDMENQAYGQLANTETDLERKRYWSQKAADMWNGAEELSAQAYFTWGDNAERRGDLTAAMEHYKQALAIWERDGDPIAIFLYGVLGDVAIQQGDNDTAKAWYQKQWQTAKDRDKPDSQAAASLDLGRIAALQGDVMEALARYQEALEIFQALRDLRSVANTLNGMGQLLIDIGAYGPAKEYLMESVRIADQIGDKQLAAVNYNDLGLLSERENDYTSAKLWYSKAAEMFEAMGDEENAAVARRNLERVTALEAGGA